MAKPYRLPTGKVILNTNNSTDDVHYLRVVNKAGKEIINLAVYEDGLVEMHLANKSNKMLSVVIESIGTNEMQMFVEDQKEHIIIDRVGQPDVSVEMNGIVIKRS